MWQTGLYVSLHICLPVTAFACSYMVLSATFHGTVASWITTSSRHASACHFSHHGTNLILQDLDFGGRHLKQLKSILASSKMTPLLLHFRILPHGCLTLAPLPSHTHTHHTPHTHCLGASLAPLLAATPHCRPRALAFCAFLAMTSLWLAVLSPLNSPRTLSRFAALPRVNLPRRTYNTLLRFDVASNIPRSFHITHAPSAFYRTHACRRPLPASLVRLVIPLPVWLNCPFFASPALV